VGEGDGSPGEWLVSVSVEGYGRFLRRRIGEIASSGSGGTDAGEGEGAVEGEDAEDGEVAEGWESEEEGEE
jgi:hypothetical protein